MQMLNVDSIEVWFLQGYVLSPLTGSRNLIDPILLPVFFITYCSEGNPFLQQLFLTSLSSLLCMQIWGIQTFLLFKNIKQKNLKTHITALRKAQKIEGKRNLTYSHYPLSTLAVLVYFLFILTSVYPHHLQWQNRGMSTLVPLARLSLDFPRGRP